MSTLSDLYLGGKPTNVSVEEDKLVIGFENGQNLTVPFQILSQFSSDKDIPEDAQVLVLITPPRIDHVHVTDSALNVFLTDGRILSCPLAWFPRLVHGNAAERNNYELVGEDDAIHWPELDEDIELSRLFEGGRSVETEASIQRWLASRQEKVAAH